MSTPTPPIESLATARFKTVKSPEAIEVTVHFNPASLQYTVSNTLRDHGSGSDKKQYVTQTSAKLTMDLVFDTTATGQDVRETTEKLAKMLKAHGPSGKQVPPLVEFGWGVYRFTGIVEQYKETLDFFAAGGIPLRAGVNLTLSSLKLVFERGQSQANVDGNLAPDAVAVPTSTGPGGPAGVANALGDPRAARAIAAANGSASLRFSGGAELAVGVGAGVTLGAAAAFSAGASAGFGVGVSGGVGLGISGGAGIGVSGGAGVGISGGVGVGVAAGASAGIGGGAGSGFAVGVSTGAGVSATADFSGLRAAISTDASMPEPSVALALTADAGSGGGMQFGLGGRAQSTGSASLSANVGANAELTARLGFGAQ
jgi:hypothetical protein